MAEDISYQQEFIKGGITLAGVAIGGWIALRNYRSNQWWESKRKSYEEAFTVLKQLEELSQLMHQQWHGEPFSTQTYPLISAGSEHDVRQKYKHAAARLNGIIGMSGYMLSDRAIDMLRKVHADAHHHREGVSMSWQARVNHFSVALRGLIEEARADLGVSSLWRRFKRVLQDLHPLFVFATAIIFLASMAFSWIFCYLWFGQERGSKAFAKIEAWWGDTMDAVAGNAFPD